MKPLIGIYEIRNIVNGHVYIGSAINIEKRWNKHTSSLKGGKHHSQYLQYAWNKYGVDCFTFSILELCDKNNLIIHEQIYIDKRCPEYNMSHIAGSRLGMKCSDETKKKMSNSAKGKTHSVETRHKISILKKGKVGWWKGKTYSDEHRKKLSEAHKGVPLSESHRESLSLALKGRPSSMKGKTHSEKSRKKMSESMKESRQRRKELFNS